MGRNSLYKADVHPRLAKYLARDGKLDKEIAEALGISTTTLYEWKKSYPEFYESLKEGKDLVDGKVEDSLLKRALGYEYEETEMIVSNDGKSKRIKKVKKHALPDTTAQIFWLKNRKPWQWRDNRHHEITGKDGGPLDVRSWIALVQKVKDER